jgi:hypothetical protein
MQLTQAVARAACVVKATELVRPLLPFPELLDQENALRKLLAEQVQSGKISLLERNIQIQKLHSKIWRKSKPGCRPPRQRSQQRYRWR